MAEDRNIHIKLGMAEGLGCVLIAYLTFMVAMWGFEQVSAGPAILAVSYWIGIGFLIVTAVAFFNENYLMSAVFGVLGVFTLAFPQIASDPVFGNGGMAVLFVGIILLVLAVVSLAQPIRLLPIFLIIAALMFFFIGLWWGDLANETYQMLTGVFAFITMLLALYFVAAVGLLVLKGKPVLPLLIKG
ncbi:MAG: hypothetical protein QW520_06870 [Methanomassiliicoccales archaeon]